MKTKKVVFLLASVLLVGVVLSCRKFIADQVMDPVISTLKGARSNVGHLFSNNPYDPIGESHNRALARADEYIQRTGKVDQAGIQAAIAAYSKKAEGREVMNVMVNASKELEKFRKAGYQDFLQHFETTDLCREYLQRLKDDTDKLTSYERQVPYLDRVNQLEGEVLAEQGLSEEDRKVLLVTMAVAKYSSAFWVEKIRFTEQHDSGKRSFLHRLIRLHAYVTTDMFAATIAALTFDADIIAAQESATMAWYVDTFIP